ERQGPAEPPGNATAARAGGRELQSEESRDAREPAERRSHSTRGFAAQRALRFRAALPGLYFTATSDPARAGPDDRGHATGREGRTNAAQARAREAARSMRRHYHCEPLSPAREEVSSRVFGRGQEAADRGDHEGSQRRRFSRLQEVRGVSAHGVRPEGT